MDQQAKIRQMRADLERFRASRSGAPSPDASAGAPAPSPAATASPIAADLERYRAAKASGRATAGQPTPEEPGFLAGLAKGVLGAPATLLARPVQAGAALLGADADQIDAATASIPLLGSLVAPTPRSYGDVKKDVGRGIETVAMGLGAPAARGVGALATKGGAAAAAKAGSAKGLFSRALSTPGAPIGSGAVFGVGSSLERGNDLFSADTAKEAAMGGVTGKLAAVAAKPIASAAGAVARTVVPRGIREAAAGVADRAAKGVEKFMDDTTLLGGVAAKPSAALARATQGVDDAIGGGFRKAGAAAKAGFKSQYPDLDPVAHFQRINERDLVQPTVVNETRFGKATRVYDEAKRREIDLEKVATKAGVRADQLADGGKYATADAVDNLREGNYAASADRLRPSLKVAEAGVERVPVSKVRDAALARVRAIPPSQVNDAQREAMVRQVERLYGPESAAARAHPNGYSLTELHDARIAAAKNGKYKVGQSPSAELGAQRSREEGAALAALLDGAVPDDLPVKAFRKELEERFLLADYLESLDGKKVPEGMTKKAVRLFGRAVAATVGGKVGGFPGSILGAQYGDLLFSTFEALPNPLKRAALARVKAEDPASFKALTGYLEKKAAEAASILKLPAPGQTSYREPGKTLFAGPGVAPRESLQEAVDVAGVESGSLRAPGTDARKDGYRSRRSRAEGAQEPYAPDRELPVIPLGPKPRKGRRIRELYGDLPTIR